MPTLHRVAAAALSAALAALDPAILGAQEDAADDSTRRARRERARRDSTPRVLPPVTVTATRGTRAVTDAAAAVTVLAPRDYAHRGGVGIDAALALAPGVLAQSRAGGTDVRLTVRGFGARGAGDRSNAGTSRGVRVLVDGIPETEPDGRTAFDNIDLAVAQGVDVVRSNASALWGNAAGGVVNVSTVPVEREPFAALQSVAGSFGLRRGVVRGGTPVGDAGRLWGTATRTTGGGWRAHSDSRRTLASGGLLAPLGGGAATTLGVYLAAADNFFRVPGPLTPGETAADPRQANAVYASRDERRHNRVGRLGVTLEHRFGPPEDAPPSVSALLFVNPKYLQRSERGTFRDFTRHHAGASALYRAGRWGSGAVSHELSSGADAALQDGAILFYSLSPDNGRGTELRDDKAEGAANLGVFLQDEIALGERLVVTLGARHDAIRYDYRSHLDPALNAAKTFSRTSPKVSALWRTGPGGSVYASVGGGVEAPAGNETDPAGTDGQDTVTAINPLLEPIVSTTYEVGAKGVAVPRGGALPAGALLAASYDVALYLTDVRNEIVPYQGGRFYFTAGRARRAGLEVGGTAALRGGVRARVAGTLSRNRYADYVVDSVHYGRPGRVADYSGRRVVGVPDWFWATQLAWAPPAAARLGLEARVGAQGTGRYWADDANRIAVPSHATASATVALGARDASRDGSRNALTVGGVAVRAFVTVENLFDRRYVASAFLNPDVVNGAPRVYEPGAPRSVVVSVTLGR